MNCHCNNQETNATIEKMEQACSAWAVIPSYTVGTSANLQGLRNAFVHVSDINTTYYIDNQLRRIITWKGPVFQDNYDYENNPLNIVDQIVYDGANNRIIIFNQTGNYQVIEDPDVNLLGIYTADPAATDAYNASYINSRLNATKVVLGSGASANNTSNAIGYGASTGTNTYATAVGMGTRTTRNYEFSVGGGSSVSTCYVSNVRAGELPTDAVNVGQLDDKMTGVQHDIENLTELTESIPTDIVTSIELVSENDGLQISTHTRNTTDGTNTDSTLEGVIQPLLESGTNIKTINGQSLLGEGDIVIEGGEGGATATSTPVASYTADNVNLAFGEDNVELTPAVGTAGGAVSKAGIMSAFQASQLAALAEAYEAEEKGTTLYEGTASTNNIELSESGFNYDHLIIVTEYMGMGSFALDQQVSYVFYPTETVKAFQMNANDITTGNAPMVQIIQDIWSITDDGMELELASALKATVNSKTEVEPDSTSHFTITKVVGFGKKEITG